MCKRDGIREKNMKIKKCKREEIMEKEMNVKMCKIWNYGRGYENIKV
jgi:hypothetical protein